MRAATVEMSFPFLVNQPGTWVSSIGSGNENIISIWGGGGILASLCGTSCDICSRFLSEGGILCFFTYTMDSSDSSLVCQTLGGQHGNWSLYLFTFSSIKDIVRIRFAPRQFSIFGIQYLFTTELKFSCCKSVHNSNKTADYSLFLTYMWFVWII